MSNQENTQPEIQIYIEQDLVIIFGIRYSLEIFRSFWFGPTGTWLRLDARADGVLTVTRASPGHGLEFDEIVG